jgi:hypothetical protein
MPYAANALLQYKPIKVMPRGMFYIGLPLLDDDMCNQKGQCEFPR